MTRFRDVAVALLFGVATAAVMTTMTSALAQTASPRIVLGPDQVNATFSVTNAAPRLSFGVAQMADGSFRYVPLDTNGIPEVDCVVGCSGGGGGGSGGAVTAASGAYAVGSLVDGAVATIGAKADTAWGGSGSASEISLLKAIYGAFATSLPAGTNAIGSIGNTGFGINGTLPAFAATPTVNLGTLNGAATAANQSAIIGPLAAGASATNSALMGCVYSSTLPTLTTGQQAAAQCDSSARLYAIGHAQISAASPSYSAGTNQPLSATTAGALRVDASATTQPVSLAALPSLAAGSATVGTFLDGSFVAQGSTTSGQIGPLMQASVSTVTPSYTTAQTAPLSMSTSGVLRTQLMTATGGVMVVAASGGTGATASLQVGGNYNSTPLVLANGQGSALTQDTTGAIYADTESQKNTFASSVSLVPATGVVWAVCGSSTKTIRVRSLTIGGTATAATTALVTLIKTSTAPSGGTTTAVSNGPLDTLTAVADTAAYTSYTAAPTGGTAVFNPWVNGVPLAVTGTYDPPVAIVFGAPLGIGSVVLRGAAQCLEVSNATTVTGGLVQITEQHTEE